MGILRADRIAGLGGANAITGSAKFFGSNYISVGKSSDFALGTGDWTVEYWAYPSSVVQYQRHFYLIGSSSNNIDGIFANDSGISFGRTNVWAPTQVTYVIERWNHYALVHDSTNMRLYINGTQVLTSTDNFGTDSEKELIIGYSNSTFGGNFDGYISNFRIENGFARYTSAFTPPNTRLTKTENTTFLGLQSSGNVLQEETGKTLTINRNGVNSTGPVASRFVPDKGEDYGTTFADNTKFDTLSYLVPPGGTTAESNRGRGVFSGGYLNGTVNASILYIDIQSEGNTVDFGTLGAATFSQGSCSSSTRGIIAGGGTPSLVNTISYVTIATTSNTTDFGDLLAARSTLNGSAGSETRGLFMGGSEPSTVDTIEYVTIASAGNSTDFGNLTEGSKYNAPTSSPTRAVRGGGRNPSNASSNVIDYVTIATTGNATDFGDLTKPGDQFSAVSSTTRAVFGNRFTNVPSPAYDATFDYITLASTGNATDFGDISGANGGGSSGVSNSIRGVFAGGQQHPAYYNVIQYITIATTGNSSNFGEFNSVGRSEQAGFSDSHGGIS